jgi:hypothetical protein
VPVEVWQSKGISAQEMTLPQGKLNLNFINKLNLILLSFKQTLQFKQIHLKKLKFI